VKEGSSSWSWCWNDAMAVVGYVELMMMIIELHEPREAAQNQPLWKLMALCSAMPP